MSRNLIPYIILGLTILMDLYCFQAVRAAFHTSTPKVKYLAYGLYVATTIFTIGFFVYSMVYNLRENSSPLSRYMLGAVLGLFISKLLLTLFLGMEDLARLVIYLFRLIFGTNSALFPSRRAFLDKSLMGLASLPFVAFIYGMVKTAYNYKIWHVDIPIVGLPDKLDGLKIVQLSDIHSGSFTEIEPIRKAIETIKELEADLFVFTGDLVNNKSSEYTQFIDIFKEIKAPMGQYSILGNHDYGDYIEWESPEVKKENLKTLKQYHRDTNWDLMCNEHRVIEYKGEKLALIGVENWGAKMHFHQYGNLTKAYAGTEDIPTKILLSHDPSHWDAEVNQKFKDIQLTLSGHTHGMQFGIETKWFRFSPIEWVYTQWAGLYSANNQNLYVNRGFGFLGYPGRVGIQPEISVLTLRKV